jgi:hypothetical protein
MTPSDQFPMAPDTILQQAVLNPFRQVPSSMITIKFRRMPATI